MTTARPKPDIARAETAVARVAAGFPETREDNPWGHRAFKVRGKTFLFLVAEGEHLSVSVKLPVSGALALELPFAEPTGYGLGKSGWISARFPSGRPIPLDMIEEWLHESFAAIAPKKLSASRPTAAAAPKAAPNAKAKPPSKAKPAPKAARPKPPPAKKSGSAAKSKVKAPARRAPVPAKRRAPASRRRT